MDMMRKVFAEIFFLLLIVLGILVLLNRGVRMQGIFFGADESASDLLHFSYPYREWWADEYLKAGKVPLWNQYLASGLPFLAEAQTGVFYPISVGLYRFLPTAYAFNWLIISSFIIAGVGTYLYARKVGLEPLLAFFSATVFVLSGFMVARVRHVPIVTAVAFMPLMFLATEYILENGKAFWALFLALFIAFSFFAGHLTTTYSILLILAAYFLVRLWLINKDIGKERTRPVVLFGAAIFISFLLSAIQLLPSIELIKYSTRGGGDIQILSLPYKLKYLALFLFPFAFGDPSRGTWDIGKDNFWENIGYFGILPLALGLFGLIWGLRKKNRYLQSLGLVFLLSFILTLGQNTPVYKLFDLAVPGFSFTRISGRFLLFVDFFGAVLASLGLKIIFEKTEKFKRIIFTSLVILVSFADLFYFGYGFNSVMPFTYLARPKSVEFLQKDKSLFRVRPLEDNQTSWQKAWKKSEGWRGNLSAYINQRENLPSDLPLLYRLASSDLIYGVTGHFSPARPNIFDDTASIELWESPDRGAKIFGMMNVKYILSTKELAKGKSLNLVYKDIGGDFPTYIYENKKVLARAYLVGKVTSYLKTEEIMSRLVADDFEPTKEVLLEKEVNQNLNCEDGKVNIDKYEDTRVEMETKSQGNCFLVLSDTYYPGWKAYLDSKEVTIYQADYVYRTILVPEGQHEIVFVYKPRSYEIGKIVSSISFGLLTSGLLLFAYQHVRKRFLKSRRLSSQAHQRLHLWS